MSSPRATHVFGPELHGEVRGQPWSHWDVWFCLVAVLDHDGDLAALEQVLVAELTPGPTARSTFEAKLSHLQDLHDRLVAAGLTPADLFTADLLADKALVAKARKKLRDRHFDGRAKTKAMHDTPEVRLTRLARYGRWPTFPCDPAPFYAHFRSQVEVRDAISERRSFGAVTQMERKLDTLNRPKLTDPQRLALHRAFHTAALELADRADDSCGVIGEMRSQAWRYYLELDWACCGMQPEDYWADLCSLVVTEQYGLGHREQALPWTRVPPTQESLVEGLLSSLESQCRSGHLTYAAEEARRQQAWLAVGTRSIDRFIEVAGRLGTDHWAEIEALAEGAMRTGGRTVAIGVFQAADRPGRHRDHLRKICLTITGTELGEA